MQSNLAESNSRNAQLDNKNKDLSSQFEKMTNENRETINKYRSENEKLNNQNMDLVSRASKLSNELESLRNQADKMQ